MSTLPSLIYTLLSLSLLVVPLVAAIWCLVALWRRRRQSADFAPGTPLGSATSRAVETIVIAAACVIWVALAVTQFDLRNLLFTDAAKSSLSTWGAAVTALAVAGLLAALIFAWRGAGSVAVVALILTVFGYSAAVSASRSKSLESFRGGVPLNNASDLNLVLDIGGCNVVGAELRANGVSLGKTPVRIKLSEFLQKVPDWQQAPEPTWQTDSTLPEDIAAAKSTPKDKHWGTLQIPDLPMFNPPGAVGNALRARKGRTIYIQVEYDGKLGVSGGGSSGGGGGENYSFYIDFQFPKRDAAIARLLNQARLADYDVNPTWLQSANEFGRDAWLALETAAVHEPDMQQVLDAWARWQYDLDPHDVGNAWQAFEQIGDQADEQGEYLTSSPAGRAVELLSPQLAPWQLAAAAEPLIESIDSYTFSQRVGPDGQLVIGVAIDPTNSQFARAGGSSTFLTSGSDRQLKPSGLALAQAIWLVNRRLHAVPETSDKPNEFQQQLAPALLRADVARRNPILLQLATLLGGPIVEEYLTRQVNHSQNLRWENSPTDFDWGLTTVNRWLFWAAQLPDPAGRRFREQHLEAVFAMADEFAKHLFGGRENIATKIPFLFVENELGPQSIGVRYWPRFRALVDENPHSALDNQLGYLVALGPAAEPDLYIEAVMEARRRNHAQFDVNTFIQWRLPQVPAEMRAAIMDGILARLVEEARPDTPVDWTRTYAIRDLREARYLKLDDPAAVDYLLKWLRDELPESEQPGLNRTAFFRDLPKSAARHANLIEALVRAPEAKLRLLAVRAIRRLPTPQNRELLRSLLEDPDEQVRQSATAAEEYWKSLATNSK